MSISSSALPKRLYKAHQVALLERLAVEKLKITSYDLMKLAGGSVFRAIKSYYPQATNLLVLAGRGNNAGDGYIVAALAQLSGMSAEVFQLCEDEKLEGDAKLAFGYAKSSKVGMRFLDKVNDIEKFCNTKTVIVDALLGTGINRPVNDSYKKVILAINHLGRPVVSVDLPSGLNVDTGKAMGLAVRAHVTVTFAGLKQGLLTGDGKEFAGEIVFDNLDIPDFIFTSEGAPEPSSERIDINYVTPSCLGRRKKSSHKGDHGHVIVLGGDLAFGGAGIMAAEAAMRSGAGLVTLVSRSEHRSAALARCPELMVVGTEDENFDLGGVLKKASAIAIGPGLGTGKWGQGILSEVLDLNLTYKTPLLIDADALNLLSERKDLIGNVKAGNWVLTPHPGEAARLLKSTKERVQADRFNAVKELAEMWGGACLLKGSGSLTCSNEPAKTIYLCSEGNAGMASGGMGDVLSGIIASLIAQGLTLSDALNCGICIHGQAGDLASVVLGERGLLATDLFSYLRPLLNPL